MNSILTSEYFKYDTLSIFVGIFIGFFSLVTILYSCGFMKGKKGLLSYYLYIVLTLIFSLGVVFANNLILLIVCWGFLGMLLYLLIGFGDKERTSTTAKKAFIIIGGTDAIMLLGVALLWRMTDSFKMDGMNVAVTTKAAVVAYLCLAAGAFAKAGAMPFHTWVPDTAEDAPTPVTAFLPASLDKLLGIYFLARISLNVFTMSHAMNTFLMIVGSVTIIAAVMMALVQHDFKRLLGFHAVSQVGYMVLGIGTANPIGIAGGLFHMVNHAIYKSCLFLSGGIVEKKTGTTSVDKLGGLAKMMPLTFITFLIASFAISGVPPFNGFVSKWMIYQGIIETAKAGGTLWVLWLVAAMFGSALTLASFMKLIHAIFLGQPSREQAEQHGDQKRTGLTMLIPVTVLAFLCILFGVGARYIPLPLFIVPSVRGTVSYIGVWSATWATILILIGCGIGVLIYFLGSIKQTREVDTFVGGEKVSEHPDMRLSGGEFYNTIKEIGILKTLYFLAEKKLFDVYEVGKNIIFGITAILRYIHNGVLPTYLAWCLLGMGVLFYIVLR